MKAISSHLLMYLQDHTNGTVLEQIRVFVQHKLPDLTYLHVFTELFFQLQEQFEI